MKKCVLLIFSLFSLFLIITACPNNPGPSQSSSSSSSNSSSVSSSSSSLSSSSNSSSTNSSSSSSISVTSNSSSSSSSKSSNSSSVASSSSSSSTVYVITASAGTGGTISPSGSVNVVSGSSQTFMITPNTGYSISSVTVDGTSVGTVSSYTFYNVMSAHTITASFAINTYTITVTQGANGTISPGTTIVNYGGSQTFTISPNTGYSISSVMVDGVNQGAISSYAFNNVTANHTLTASFSINTYTITVTQGANGTISPGTLTVNYNGSKTFTITPNTGYYIAGISVNGSSIGMTPQGTAYSYTFYNVAANQSITAAFNPVYTGGSDGSSACYWIGTTEHSLNSPGGMVNSIFVSGSTVYCAGVDSTNCACFWQGTTEYPLKSGNGGTAYSISVYGALVYVAGQNSTGAACYWDINDNIYYYLASPTGIIYSIFIDQTYFDMYAAGWFPSTACYWWGGAPNEGATYFKEDTLSGGDTPYSIFETNIGGTSTVYVAGDTLQNSVDLPCYWSGTAGGTASMISLPCGNAGVAQSIFVVGSTVYTAGADVSGSTQWACYWTGQNETKLNTGSCALGIYVKGSTVYTAGWFSSQAALWTGTSLYTLSTTLGSTAKCIFVP